MMTHETMISKIMSLRALSYFCGLVLLICIRYNYMTFLKKELYLFQKKCKQNYAERKSDVEIVEEGGSEN